MASPLHEIANRGGVEGSCPLAHFLGQLGSEGGFLVPAVKVHSLPDLPFLRTHSQGGQQHHAHPRLHRPFALLCFDENNAPPLQKFSAILTLGATTVG